MAGRLYICGLTDAGSWDPVHPVYWDESAVDLVTNPAAGDRKVRTVVELEEVVKFSSGGLRAIKVWILEGLADAAWRLFARCAVAHSEPEATP